MDVVIQLSLLAVSACVGAAALVLRGSSRRPNGDLRIDVNPVSRTWLADHRTRSRPE